MPEPRDPSNVEAPSGEVRLLKEITEREILAEDQAVAGHTILATVFAEPWREWIERLAPHCGIDIKELLKRALVEYAARQGFAEPPPR